MNRRAIVICIIGIGMLLVWCGGKSTPSLIEAGNYITLYQGSRALILQEPSSDPAKIVYLEVVPTETKNNQANAYTDSLIITEQYNQRKGALVFAQETLNSLTNQSLMQKDLKIEKITLLCAEKRQSMVLVSYNITENLAIATLPLYMTHLFIEKDANTLTIFSHSTDSRAEQKKMVDALRKLTCTS